MLCFLGLPLLALHVQIWHVAYPHDIVCTHPFGLNTSAPKKPKMIAAEIPALVTSKIPVMIPMTPSACISCMAPCTSALPKLVIGTVAPAPANLISGSYQPNPCR